MSDRNKLSWNYCEWHVDSLVKIMGSTSTSGLPAWRLFSLLQCLKKKRCKASHGLDPNHWILFRSHFSWCQSFAFCLILRFSIFSYDAIYFFLYIVVVNQQFHRISLSLSNTKKLILFSGKRSRSIWVQYFLLKLCSGRRRWVGGRWREERG